MKLRSHQPQAVTSASAPVAVASSRRSAAVHAEYSGIASRHATAGAAAPAVLADPLHLDELDARDRPEQVARLVVDALGAVVAGLRASRG